MTLYFLTKSSFYYESIVPKNHIICDSKFINNVNLIKSQNPSLYDLNFINLPIDNILNNIDETPILKEEISTSVFHKQRYKNMVDQNLITYEGFCHLEKDIANIIDKYTLDKKHHWCIFIHKNFLYGDSFRRFLSKPAQKNILWISDSIEIGFPDMIMWNDDISFEI
jgi:hypothetical protein